MLTEDYLPVDVVAAKVDRTEKALILAARQGKIRGEKRRTRPAWHLSLSDTERYVRETRSGRRPGTRVADLQRHKTPANHRLTEDDVRAMRAAYTGTPAEVTHLARQYRISKTQVVRILRRERWAHI